METSLPTEVIFNLLLSSDFDTITNLCLTSSAINNVCQNDHFWQQKFIQDFGNFPKVSNKTWRQSYEVMLSTIQYLNHIIKVPTFLVYEITNIDFINRYMGIAVDEPIRLAIHYNHNDDMFHILYDAIDYQFPQPGVTLRTYASIGENIVTSHDLKNFIYVLLGLGIEPEITRFLNNMIQD